MYTQSGSSPLTRGKHEEVRLGGVRVGLIPTHAGKTRSARSGGATPRAHPHSRGKNEMSDQVSAVAAGSSPLTRGKPPAKRPQRYQERLIPAHAGKTNALG